MKKFYCSRSSLFLIELILSIFFFIVSAAIVLQLFVTSHFITNDTININNSLYHSQNISEIFLGSNADFTYVQNHYKENSCTKLSTYKDDIDFTDDSVILLLFNKEWQSVTDTDCAEYLILSHYHITPAGEYGTYNVLTTCIAEYTGETQDILSDKNFPALLTCESYIHHLEVKKYKTHK